MDTGGAVGWVLSVLGAAAAWFFFYFLGDSLRRYRGRPPEARLDGHRFVGGLLAWPITTTYGVTTLTVSDRCLVIEPRFRLFAALHPTWTLPRASVVEVEPVRLALLARGVRLWTDQGSLIFTTYGNIYQPLLRDLIASGYPVAERERRVSVFARRRRP